MRLTMLSIGLLVGFLASIAISPASGSEARVSDPHPQILRSQARQQKMLKNLVASTARQETVLNNLATRIDGYATVNASAHDRTHRKLDYLCRELLHQGLTCNE